MFGYEPLWNAEFAVTTDPLKGQRQAINEGTTEVLWWVDVGKGCPVEVGQIFKLRTCSIEITRTKRTRKGREWRWVAYFTRYHHAAGHWLDKRGGMTDDVRAAMAAQDDPDAPTIDHGDPAAAAVESPDLPHPITGEAPEPQSIPPHEVRGLPTSIAARARYQELHRDETERRLQRSLVEEIREAHLTPEEVERVREALGQIRSGRRAAA